jgi:hypothetical protein
MSEDGLELGVPETTDEVVLTDLDAVQEQRQIKPKAQGVRVKIEKPSVRKSLSDGAKDAPKEGPNNPVAYKYLNCTLRLLDGISSPVLDENGQQTGETEIKYKNSVLFPNKMDLIFWHNPEVKTSNWWKNQQYIFGFKALCKALGFNMKEVKINDAFLDAIKDKEILIDIEHEENNDLKDGNWVGNGTFKERVRNIRAWN